MPYAGIGALLEAMADRHEEKTFLVFYSDEGGRSEISYREFHERTARAAHYLASLGIVRGDRVATLSVNHPDVVVQYFAAFLLGAVVVPLNPGEDDRRIAYILQNSRARVLLVRDRFADRIRPLAAALSVDPPSLSPRVPLLPISRRSRNGSPPALPDRGNPPSTTSRSSCIRPGRREIRKGSC